LGGRKLFWVHQEEQQMIRGLRIVLLFPVICFAFLFQPGSLHADCLACFELKGVRVTMKGGQKYSGYVGWNTAWFTSREKSKFPDTLLDRERWGPYPRESIMLYRKVYPIRFPVTALVTRNRDLLTLRFSDVTSMSAKPMEHDGYQGAGGLPVLSMTAIRLLSESKPYASIRQDADVSDHYLISFNPEIDEPKLRKIYDDIKNWLTNEKIKELEESRIIFFNLSYD
jgi:hypothetical protein